MNLTSQYDFTIVVPIYNEQDNILPLERAFRNYLSNCSRRACVLFVNDGSTDGSLERIAKICRRNSGFYYISFERNAGLSAAIKAGIDYVESPLVGYMDADLQTSPEDFERLLPYADSCALVRGLSEVGLKLIEAAYDVSSEGLEVNDGSASCHNVNESAIALKSIKIDLLTGGESSKQFLFHKNLPFFKKN